MSIILGIRKAEEQTVKKDYLTRLALVTDQYARDGTFIKTAGRIGMAFQPYHTHKRSNLEAQPAVNERGSMLVFDGRLDNHAELCAVLDIRDSDTPDSRIVLVAFERWGERCFSHLIGDWAIALWSPSCRSLFLARDHAGIRTLYYEIAGDTLSWSTHLETFFADGQIRDIDENYAARYLASQPIGDLTPYKGISAVTPAHYVIFCEGKITRKPHWRWIVEDKLRYQTNREYEEHFSMLFMQAVERRTGGGAPILAHLSGGMDSTSIVCMSDHIRRARGATSEHFVDTLSYYDNTEPNWNEIPYFSAVEAQRGKSGHHVQVSISDKSFKLIDPNAGRYMLPGADLATLERETVLQKLASEKGYRSILSGLGGDELAGGVPNATPELADYLTSGKIMQLLAGATSWSLAARVPVIHTVGNVLATTFRLYLFGSDSTTRPAWCGKDLSYEKHEPIEPPISLLSRIGSRPSALINGSTWWHLLETLPSRLPAAGERFEYRFPFLDRDLVDYLYRIPRGQLIRPGCRKSLLRRSVAGIVPSAILQRTRKAYIARAPLLLLKNSRPDIERLMTESVLSKCGLIDKVRFNRYLDSAIRTADLTHWFPIMKTLWMEIWWQSMNASRPCSDSIPMASASLIMGAGGNSSNRIA
jgi:asparagine synthase (glutamine-hydrolysing)